MKVVVDLNQCQDQGQCVFAAPTVFSLDGNGRLTLRQQASDTFVSGELDESLRDAVEEAADVCPRQAIEIKD